MRVISVVGVRAGTGATTTAVNLAIRLARRGETVCLIDAAPASGDIRFFLGLTTSIRTAEQLLDHQGRIRRDHVADYLFITRAGISGMVLSHPSLWPAVLPLLSNFSTVVADGLMPESDHVLLVATPHPLALRQLSAAMARLKSDLVPGECVSVVANAISKTDASVRDAVHAQLGARAVYPISDEAEALRNALVVGAPLALRDDASISAEWDQIATDMVALPERAQSVVADGVALRRRLLIDFQEQGKGIHDRVEAASLMRQLLADVPLHERDGILAEAVVSDVVHEALGLGPLEPLMSDPHITEIMVNGPHHLYIEKAGRLEHLSHTIPEDSLIRIIERILAPTGRRVDESSPMVDARLPDGSRVNIVIPPLSLNGPVLTIRRFSSLPWRLADFVASGSLSPDMAEILRQAMRHRLNVIVSGGTGSGKTSLLNVLSAEIAEDERIITIEDAAELRLLQPHVLRLESRPPNLEGRGEISIRDLVKNALRMRPNRIIVGECRGAEALDMLQAMNTGHDGSLTTIHANSPRAALSRLETLVMFAGMDLPVRAIRDQIATAIHLIVQVARTKEGSRRVVQISEIVGQQGDVISLQDLAGYRDGQFVQSGFRPRFLERGGVHG
jgi:Flp pilus assembly CpaF family ATPase/MinD-like ATPase involved in chromosome partitioning or flagellar assembly